MADNQRKRVLIPDGYWTPFPNELFTSWLCDFVEDESLATYALLHDRAAHNRKRSVNATLDDIAESLDLDVERVKECTKELRNKKLIRYHKTHSDGRQRRTPKWTVRFASPDLNAGNWTPIPRFVIRRYVGAYRDSVILLFLLWFQNNFWRNEVFPSVETLSNAIGWSQQRVAHAVSTMSDSERWKALRTGLKRPLTVERYREQGKPLNHYHVRAVVYEEKEGFRTVRVSKTFAREFHVPDLE